MLNNKGQRELAYAVEISDVRPIEGADNVELVMVNGWTVMVRKDLHYKPGDIAIYFEIDSKVPERPEFEFLRSKKFAVKTQRYFKGTVLSQGLVMHPNELNLKDVKVGDCLTEQLGVTYYEASDNQRKANHSKYTSMMARHKRFFQSKLGKWLMKREWGRRLCFFLFGKKKDKKRDWPSWVVKSDEERCQNLPFLFTRQDLSSDWKDACDHGWIVTEKIDGTSTTFTMRRNRRKLEYLVCSRNVVFDSPKKEDKNYYRDTEGNVYLEMSEKYHMKEVLENEFRLWDLYREKGYSPLEYITIQGETYGGNIQKRDYGKEHRLAIFNIIIKCEADEKPRRLNPVEMHEWIRLTNNNLGKELGIKLEGVPIVETDYVLPDSCEELLEYAGGKSQIDGEMREGIVLRAYDGGKSFKAVDNNYLLKYHS